jgi:hypothetical protein
VRTTAHHLGRFLRLLLACVAFLAPAVPAQVPEPDAVGSFSGKPPVATEAQPSRAARRSEPVARPRAPARRAVAHRAEGPPRARYLWHRALLR